MYHQQQRVYYEMANDTKLFVGGLAWETQRDAVRLYFQQFGEIIEAVVISDKYTGRSKGYGFVTFKDVDAAIRACENPNPVIDGRKANCNLASLGARNNNIVPHVYHHYGNIVPHVYHHYGTLPYRPGPEFVTPSPSACYSSSPSPYYPQYAFTYPSASYGYNNNNYNNNFGFTQAATMHPMNYMSNPPTYGGQSAAYYYNNGGGVYSNMYEHAQQPHHQHSNTASTSNYGVFHNYPQMSYYPPPYFQSIPSSSSSLPTATITIASPDSTTETQNTAGVAANKESNQ